MVGQRMVQLLAKHPWLELACVAASQRSAGQIYSAATRWRLPGQCPPRAAGMRVLACSPDQIPAGVKIVLSALDSAVAGPIEDAFRAAGFAVLSNAANHRMDIDVPLVIPEVNPDHLALLDRRQTDGDPAAGFILANPNCCAIPTAMALAPLHERWPIQAAIVSTWQAVSGAGYPGESAWDMVGSVHPHPGNEEQKLTQEPQKILGLPGTPADFPISARCVRVPTAEGHLIGIHARLKGDPSPTDAAEALRTWTGKAPPLPSSPRPLVHLSTQRDRPATRFDVDAGDGMAITIGRIETCPILGIKLYVLAHNTIRGAAGAAILNAELLVLTRRI
ncbi:MAG: aspartate-semialdehyde dehydrogenase [Oligoflexia bacterium]|nr:aspartate-semialdehyde dehydrogenase [Oligoflexia bacterium]